MPWRCRALVCTGPRRGGESRWPMRHRGIRARWGGLRLPGGCADGNRGGPGGAALARRHGGAPRVVAQRTPRPGRRGPGAGRVHAHRAPREAHHGTGGTGGGAHRDAVGRQAPPCGGPPPGPPGCGTRRRPPPAGGLQGPADPRRQGHQCLCGNPRAAWRERAGLGGAVAACAALHEGPDQHYPRHGRLDPVEAQPGASGAGQFALEHARGQRPGGGGRHFHKVQGPGGRQCGRCGRGRHLFFQACQAHPSLCGHARGGKTAASATACSQSARGKRALECVRVWRQCSNCPAHWSSWCSAGQWGSIGMIASMSSGAFRKDDGRRRNIEIHAGWSEAHDRLPAEIHGRSSETRC
jgi:hypothetical protein